MYRELDGGIDHWLVMLSPIGRAVCIYSNTIDELKSFIVNDRLSSCTHPLLTSIIRSRLIPFGATG